MNINFTIVPWNILVGIANLILAVLLILTGMSLLDVPISDGSAIDMVMRCAGLFLIMQAGRIELVK